MFMVSANVVVPATFLSAGKAMELVEIHHESKCATTQQDNAQFTHGQSSFTRSTPTNNTLIHTYR
jgi:hypothetical protein